MTQTAPIPGLSEHTTTGALITALRTLPQRPLQFHLHGTLLVPAGYHVTEVKAVTIEAMDCGGHANAWRETVIQLMDGNAEEASAGFMTNRKFLAIYDRVTRHIPCGPRPRCASNTATPAIRPCTTTSRTLTISPTRSPCTCAHRASSAKPGTPAVCPQRPPVTAANPPPAAAPPGAHHAGLTVLRPQHTFTPVPTTALQSAVR